VIDSTKSVGLTVGSNSLNTIWNCPDRPTNWPVYEQPYEQWVIGYQYFGGIDNWMNDFGSLAPGFSPIKFSTAKPHWTLAAEGLMRDGINGPWGVWAPGRDTDLWAGLPPHRCGTKAAPKGGNHVFADGSGKWVRIEDTYRFHSWAPASRVCYFYQDPKDIRDSGGGTVQGIPFALWESRLRYQ
jgi:hypothetical protein